MGILTLLIYKGIRWMDECITLAQQPGNATILYGTPSTLIECLIGGFAVALITYGIRAALTKDDGSNVDVNVVTNGTNDNTPTNPNQDCN